MAVLTFSLKKAVTYPRSLGVKVTGYLELYDFMYVYIYATKTGILKSYHMELGAHKHHT